MQTQAVEEHKNFNLKTFFHNGQFEYPFAGFLTSRNHSNDPVPSNQHPNMTLHNCPPKLAIAFHHVVFASYFLRPLLLYIRQVITWSNGTVHNSNRNAVLNPCHSDKKQSIASLYFGPLMNYSIGGD